MVANTDRVGPGKPNKPFEEMLMLSRRFTLSSLMIAVLATPQVVMAAGSSSIGKAIGGAAGGMTDNIGSALGKSLDNMNIGKAAGDAASSAPAGVRTAPVAPPSRPVGGPTFKRPDVPTSVSRPDQVP
jgi:hypothetical protein